MYIYVCMCVLFDEHCAPGSLLSLMNAHPHTRIHIHTCMYIYICMEICIICVHWCDIYAYMPVYHICMHVCMYCMYVHIHL